MGIKIRSAIEKIKYFCATKSFQFYFGMVLTVFGLILTTSFMPLIYCALISPFFTVFCYFWARLIHETPSEIKNDSELAGKILASLLGCLWVTLFLLV